MNTKHLEYLNDLFNSEIDKRKLLGASILIHKDGEKVFENVYGSDGLDTIYKIYSMSKPITAVAFMILYERGLVDIDDEVAKYLPAYANMKVWHGGRLVDAKNKLTIRHLLNMTSGLVYPGVETEPERIMERIHVDLHDRAMAGEKMTNLSILNELAKAPLLFEPGSEWHYGLSTDVVAGIVEVISGKRFSEFLNDEIFTPLQMTDTAFYVPSEKITRLAKMYAWENMSGTLRLANKDELEYLNEYAPTKEPFIESGGGGLYSTLHDYSRFARMLAGGGQLDGVRILGSKTVKFLSTNQLTDAQRDTIYFDSIVGYGYGNCNRVMMDLAKANSNGSVGEFGWDGLPGCYFMVDPTENLTVVYMQQIMQGADHELRHKYRQIIYAAL